MRLPRDVSGADVVRALERLGFEAVRQSGSHIRLALGSLRVTVPAHQSIAPGTLKSIMAQAGIDLDTLAGHLK